LPASTLKVVPVVTVDSKLIPAAVAAITPDVLNTLLTTVPLIIFSYNLLSYYALVEYPKPPGSFLAVPTPVISALITPEVETKFFVLRSLVGLFAVP